MTQVKFEIVYFLFIFVLRPQKNGQAPIFSKFASLKLKLLRNFLYEGIHNGRLGLNIGHFGSNFKLP